MALETEADRKYESAAKVAQQIMYYYTHINRHITADISQHSAGCEVLSSLTRSFLNGNSWHLPLPDQGNEESTSLPCGDYASHKAIVSRMVTLT